MQFRALFQRFKLPLLPQCIHFYGLQERTVFKRCKEKWLNLLSWNGLLLNVVLITWDFFCSKRGDQFDRIIFLRTQPSKNNISLLIIASFCNFLLQFVKYCSSCKIFWSFIHDWNNNSNQKNKCFRHKEEEGASRKTLLELFAAAFGAREREKKERKR